MKTTQRAFVAVGAAGSLILAGCGGGADDGASPDAESTEITWSFWIGGAEDQALWNDLGGLVTAQYPEITMNLQGAPWNDYWTKLPTQLSSADAQCVFGIQGPRVTQFKDSMLPLDELIAENDIDLSAFDEVALEAMTVDGEVYALPYDTGPTIMFYNKDVFDAAGVTVEQNWTADEFEAAARAIKDTSGMATLGNTPSATDALAIAYAYNGAFVWQDDGSIDLEDERLAEAWQWQADLEAEGLAQAAITGDADSPRTDFTTGLVATYVGGPWDVIDIATAVDFTVGVVTLPAGPDGQGTLSSGSGFGISQSCGTPDEAMKAVSVLTGDKALSTLASGGRAFVARTAQQDAWFEVASDAAGVQEALTAAQAESVPRPGSHDTTKLAQLLLQYAPSALNGDADPAQVLSDIQSQLG